MLKKLAALPLLAFFVFIEPLQAVAQQNTPQQTPPQPPLDYYGYGHGPWGMWHSGYGWHFWGMFPMMILFLVLVCGAVYIFAHRCGCRRGMHQYGPSSHSMNGPGGDPNYLALQILNERFARGEIQKDEFTDKRATILSSGRN